LGQIKAAKPEIPVMVVTGYPESELVMRALNYGPLGIMKKPFKTSEAISVVRNYFHPYSLGK
jgi:DNA-binding NarL/FixJ family response regulator